MSCDGGILHFIFVINLLYHTFRCTEPVKITSPSNSEVVSKIEGEAVPLVCVATGYPLPRVTWSKAGKPVGIKENATIVNSKKDDAGTYMCTATNGVKEAKSVTIIVRILCKFILTFKDVVV